MAGSLPLPDLIELPVSAKPNVTTDTGLQFNTFASARSFDQNEFWIQELSTKTNIYNSPARSFTVKDWEVLEAGSTTQHRTGIGTYDNFDTSTDHMVPSDILLPPATTSSFADAIAAEDGPDSENELAIPTESRSSPIDIEGFTGSLESSLVDPKIREDNEFGIATTTVTDTYITATEELAANLDRVDSGIRTSNSTDAHGLAEHDIPVLCPGEACGQTFVCNLVAAMDYRPSKCILSRKRMYVYGCFIDSNGMLRYIHKLGQSKSRPAVSPAVCNGGSAAPISLVVPSVKTLSSSLMSAIIEMLHFEAAPSGGGDFMISFRDIMGLHRRRYLLAHKGVEIFLVSGRSLFLAFPSSSLRNAFCTEVLKHCPHISALDICISAESADDIFQTTPLGLTPLAAYWYHRQRQLSRSPMTGAGILSATAIAAPLHVVSLQAATDRWVAGDMTNFEYIMTLNTYSGRTFNDWTQYPVFPWVLKDYSSSMLNLDDASVYRDLSKPMGALHEVREREARKKYDILEHQAREPSDKCMEQLVDGTDGNMPLAMMPFHYGTNYSSAAAVLHYMVSLSVLAAQRRSQCTLLGAAAAVCRPRSSLSRR